MQRARYPSLYQINTRAWLRALSCRRGKPCTLDDVPDHELDSLAGFGFDWVWLLGVWQTGLAGQRVSRTNPEWRREFHETLPDLTDDDIGGSCFAVTGYNVHSALGGDAALVRLRDRLQRRGLRLLLDFVPNHVAPDHPWVEEHPEFFVPGTDSDLATAPQNWTRITTSRGRRLLAYGRDPFYPGWPDTLQLNYSNRELQEAMTQILLRLVGMCDGVRCDMAMLVLPDVFQRTWGIPVEPFWPRAIPRVRQQRPQFIFMAEVYWDREWELQQQGFDYTYDKRLYDRLRDRRTRSVREHMFAGLDFQDKLVRFLENHDEPRAAATFESRQHEATAVVTFFAPGLRFFHQGQFEGRRKRLSPHLCRWPDEPTDQHLSGFYRRIADRLRDPVFRDGDWRLLDCVSAWDGNWTWDCFIAYAWRGQDGQRRLVTVNYAPHQSQCYVRLPFTDLSGRQVQLKDLLNDSAFDRDGSDLLHRGLYLDSPAWGHHVFHVRDAT